MGTFQGWIGIIQNDGLFDFYESVQERPYPPISIFLLATAKGDFASIKLPSLIGEVLIVGVAYIWLRRETTLRWLIPGLLALQPGLIITTAWWGQNDALFTLAVLLVLIALNRDRPLIAWVLFGVALATKQQSVVIAPLMVVLSFRRYGWRRTMVGGLLAAFILGGTFLPFIFASGVNAALSPYLGLSSTISSITNNAFDFWYALAGISGIRTDTSDGALFLGSLTYNRFGLLLMAGYTLVVCYIMWKHAERRYEFIWASALYLGAFTLQTQMHERYLYPAAVLSLLAIQQKRRIWPIAVGIQLTFTYNMIYLAEPTTWLGLPLVASPAGTMPVALMNIVLLFEMLRISIRPLHLARWQLVRTSGRVFFRTLRISAAGLALIIFITSIGMALGSYAIGQWLGLHAADHSRIAVEKAARYTGTVASTWVQGHTWDWWNVTDIGEKTISAWLGDGVHYLLVDLTDDEGASDRRQALVNEPTTLLYEYQSPLQFGPHFAVLWTFRPDYPLYVTFDDSLLLIGYHVLNTERGKSLLFHWYTRQTTTAMYTAFIHLLDSETGALIAQADTPLGGGNHPTNSWRLNELVFETIALPSVNRPYFIRMGLYEQDRRATINDRQGNPIGDHIDFSP